MHGHGPQIVTEIKMVNKQMLNVINNGKTTAPQDIAREDAASFDVYRQLRVDIISCRLKPNEKLRFEALRKRYGAGVGTLREALSHLVSDGLVRIDVGRGFKVSPVSVEDLQDVTSWRIEFETRALETSIGNGDDNWEAEIITSYHLLSKIKVPRVDAPAEEIYDYGEKHMRFHNALVAACGSPWLMFFRSALQTQALRYQALAMIDREHMVNRAVDEHQAIMNAVIERDNKQAMALITHHIQQTSDDVNALLETSGRLDEFSPEPVVDEKPRRRGRPRKTA